MSSSHFTNDVWILGATGHVGRAVAARLVERNIVPVLVGRDRERLSQLAAALSKEPRTIVAASPEEIATEISQQRPAVVINTIGPFTETTVLIAHTCLPYSHYIDLANDAISVSALLDLHEEAVAAGRTLVTGAGFGVLATESVVIKLCQDRPTPDRVRTDMLPSIEIEAGVIGEALAATLIDGLPYGGCSYKRGRLVRNMRSRWMFEQRREQLVKKRKKRGAQRSWKISPVLRPATRESGQRLLEMTDQASPLIGRALGVGAVYNPQTQHWLVWLSTNGMDISIIVAHNEENRANEVVGAIAEAIRTGKLESDEMETLFAAWTAGGVPEPPLTDEMIATIGQSIKQHPVPLPASEEP